MCHPGRGLEFLLACSSVLVEVASEASGGAAPPGEWFAGDELLVISLWEEPAVPELACYPRHLHTTQLPFPLRVQGNQN